MNARQDAYEDGYILGYQGDRNRARVSSWACQEALAEDFWQGYRNGQNQRRLEVAAKEAQT